MNKQHEYLKNQLNQSQVTVESSFTGTKVTFPLDTFNKHFKLHMSFFSTLMWFANSACSARLKILKIVLDFLYNMVEQKK